MSESDQYTSWGEAPAPGSPEGEARQSTAHPEPAVPASRTEPVQGERRREPTFEGMEEEALEKVPLAWEIRTALIGIAFTLPVAVVYVFYGDFGPRRFSILLVLMGVLCGLGFRFFSRPWTIPVTSLVTATLVMAGSVVMAGIVEAAAYAEMPLLSYAFTTLTSEPLKLLEDGMELGSGWGSGKRAFGGLMLGAVSAFWLACND